MHHERATSFKYYPPPLQKKLDLPWPLKTLHLYTGPCGSVGMFVWNPRTILLSQAHEPAINSRSDNPKAIPVCACQEYFQRSDTCRGSPGNEHILWRWRLGVAQDEEHDPRNEQKIFMSAKEQNLIFTLFSLMSHRIIIVQTCFPMGSKKDIIVMMIMTMTQ